MIKLVMEDYCCRFFFMVKVYFKQINTYIWLVFFYMVLWKTDFFKYCVGMLPMLFGLLLSRMFPNQLNKLLFLCPMDEKDRKKYLITTYFVRVGVSTALFLMLSIPLLMMGYLSLTEFLAVSILTVSFILGANMYHHFLSLFVVRETWDKVFWLTFAYGVLNLLSQINVWVAMIFFSTMGKHMLHPDTDQKILTCFVCIEVLINAVICGSCFKPVIKHGICYECGAMYMERDAKQ